MRPTQQVPCGASAVRALLAVVLLVGAVVPASARAAQTEAGTSGSLLGSYLSGRFARSRYETSAAAAFYRAALAQDPDDEVLIEQAFLSEASEGNWDNAVPLASRLIKVSSTHRLARTLLGLVAYREGRYGDADAHLKIAGAGPIGELTSTLTRAWIQLNFGEVDKALALLDAPSRADWARYYLRYHRALLADIAARDEEARAAYQQIFRQDPRALRTTLAYARHAANAGDMKLAKSILRDHIAKASGEGHPLVRDLLARLSRDDVGIMPRLITSPSEGLSEVFYGLGEALTTEGGLGIGILYLRYSLYLMPDSAFALAGLANAQESAKLYSQAIDTYDRIPTGTPLQSSVQIRKAFALNALDRVDEAIALLKKVTAEAPGEIRPLDALGSILRSHKRYEEAAAYYSKVISLIQKPEPRHWTYFYARGTSYERAKRWPEAEADLQKALKLSPDQPLVLNYLGYSWIDQNQNLTSGMSLIKKAVDLRPDDGYIVDSLGWAHYRLGNYEDAVKHLERAVELRPEDPVINDHLGDALWKVGRMREARFQWEQALTLKPEPEDETKIKEKIASGLDVPKRAALEPDVANGPVPEKRAGAELAPPAKPIVPAASPPVQAQ